MATKKHKERKKKAEDQGRGLSSKPAVCPGLLLCFLCFFVAVLIPTKRYISDRTLPRRHHPGGTHTSHQAAGVGGSDDRLSAHEGHALARLVRFRPCSRHAHDRRRSRHLPRLLEKPRDGGNAETAPGAGQRMRPEGPHP